MKKSFILVLSVMMMALNGCGAGTAGQKTGQVIRAPYDFITGLGRGIQGKDRLPLREFRQDWSEPVQDPVFWESDDQFFAGIQ